MTRDEVVMGPDDIRLLLPVFHTPSACAGAATAYVLRRIAYRAGAYAPGIQEGMFHELNTPRAGGSLEDVQRWFDGRVSSLHELGYRLQCRRVAGATAALLDWVKAGKGYRGALVPVELAKLRPEAGEHPIHAVGITVDRLDAKTDEELVMIDPWPGVAGASDRSKVPATLEPAHRARGYHALVYYWVGWS